jgi:signal transduction histidine kinase
MTDSDDLARNAIWRRHPDKPDTGILIASRGSSTATVQNIEKMPRPGTSDRARTGARRQRTEAARKPTKKATRDNDRMRSAPIPENETDRINRLKLYRILDTPPEEAFDRVTRIVAETIGVPIALISLIDGERQWFKSKHGLDATCAPREAGFCAHTILTDGLLEIEDARLDPRFSGNPMVVNDPSIRFYAGAPLRAPGGVNIGTLCALDRKPRKLTDKQRQLLSDLADIVIDELELRAALRRAMSEVAAEIKKRAIENEFISLVTHELRTPLTSIRGSLALLDGMAIKGIPKQAADMIAIANRNVGTLLRLVNDLLDFQKFEAGKMNIDFDVVDSRKLLRDTCENMNGFAGEKGVRIRVKSEAKATIVGDGARLSQALTNLISNAIRFSPENGEVVVESGIRGENLRILVKDKGPGIPEAFQDQVFRKFSQAPGQNNVKGTGLGLAISKAIIEAHRGAIGFDTALGRGTTFHVEIPLRQTIVA